jgi:hypothetical protein
MHKRLMLMSMAILLVWGFMFTSGFAGPEKIVGKWQIKAETPDGPRDLEFEFKLEGTTLAGIISSARGSAPLSALKFEDPSFAAEVNTGSDNFKLTATLKDGKLAGTWEQVGTGAKGTWVAERKAASASTAPAATGGPAILGTWMVVAVTPEGDMPFQAEFSQSGTTLSGKMIVQSGEIPLQKLQFSENKLTFQLDFRGGTYKVEATLTNDKFAGRWADVNGSDSGTLAAERKKP